MSEFKFPIPKSDTTCEFKLPEPEADRLVAARSSSRFIGVPNAAREVIFGQPPLILPLLPNAGTVSMLDVPTGGLTFPFKDPFDELVAGIIFSNSKVPKQDVKGLVLMIHGQPVFPAGRYPACFKSIATRLAANGYIAVSLKHDKGGTLNATESIIRGARYVMDYFRVQFNLTGKPLALIGHSEGASAAMLAGKRIPQEVGEYFDSVKVIVAMAPSLGNFTPADLAGCCNSLLVLQGTHDTDSTFGGQSLERYNDAAVPEKYFGWLHGCNHARCLDDGSADPVTIAYITKDDAVSLLGNGIQALAVANYAAMFIIGHLSSDFKYRLVFNGEKIISWKQPGLSDDVATQLSTKFRFLPLYSFPASTITLGPLPTSASFVGLSDFQDVPLSPKNYSYASLRTLHFTLAPEKTSGFLVRWNKAKVPSPKLTIACSNPEIKTIVATAVEFDAIQVLESKKSPVPTKLQVSIKHTTGVSNIVEVHVEPSLWLDGKTSGGGNPIRRSMLSTVRIPMFKFGLSPFETKAMQELRISFDLAPSSGLMAFANFRITKPF